MAAESKPQCTKLTKRQQRNRVAQRRGRDLSSWWAGSRGKKGKTCFNALADLLATEYFPSKKKTNLIFSCGGHIQVSKEWLSLASAGWRCLLPLPKERGKRSNERNERNERNKKKGRMINYETTTTATKEKQHGRKRRSGWWKVQTNGTTTATHDAASAAPRSGAPHRYFSLDETLQHLYFPA